MLRAMPARKVAMASDVLLGAYPHPCSWSRAADVVYRRLSWRGGEDFRNWLDFVSTAAIDHVGVFRYSQEEERLLGSWQIKYPKRRSKNAGSG